MQNAAPWTYFGAVPVDPCPHASFETGLDLFALRGLGPLTTMRAAARMLSRADRGSSGTSIIRWHDQATFTLDAEQAVPIQIDGEGMGITARAAFSAHPGALLVMGP
ncbi:MAG: hypothetical protein EBY47_05895 [Actinobacteria bacterium]|nr:hypothetical protein [Actinomycetota bacterium]